MTIEFDETKNAANMLKHGISLTAALDIDLDQATLIQDVRFDYGEERFVAYGPIKGRLHVLYFTMRGTVMRPIGLRKANDRERKRYARSI